MRMGTTAARRASVKLPAKSVAQKSIAVHTSVAPISSPLAAPGACACGGGCPRCQRKYPLQAKLKVSQPGDALEQEADRIAHQMLARPAHLDAGGVPPRIQRYAGHT